MFAVRLKVVSEAALSLIKCLLREVASSTESRFGGYSVAEKVFAQRGGHVRPKVVSEAALSLRTCLLREVATSDRK